jgi:hypothetical protein
MSGRTEESDLSASNMDVLFISPELKISTAFCDALKQSLMYCLADS